MSALFEANQDPMRVLCNDDVYIQQLPKTDDELLIADLPNGYFGGDRNAFQNHAVIRHLSSRYGYRFFGIGASWLGFFREQAIRPAEAIALVDDPALLCAGDVQSRNCQSLVEVLQSTRTLLLGYAENFANVLLD